MKLGYRALLEAAEREIETLDAATVQNLLVRGDIELVDIRDIRELQREGRIPGAHHAPRGMLEFWVDPDSPYHRELFASGARFVFYCQSGWRSALATQQVQRMGLAPVAHLGGGFRAWKDCGLPVDLE